MAVTAADLEHACRVRPYPGQVVSGDTVVARPLPDGLLVAIVDVLGHGPEAHELTGFISDFLERAPVGDVGRLMEGLHGHLRGTRGAAAGLCVIDAAAGHADYAGIGNTAIRRFGAAETRLVSQEGVLGQRMRTPKVQRMALSPGDVLVLYTDGVSDRFTHEDYPAILQHAPEEVARNIVQRFGKGHDDAACVAVRCPT